MNKLFIIPITLLIIVGCAKKQALITPEKLLKETEFVGADPVTENIKVENIAVTPVVETLIEPEPAAVEEIFPEQEDAAEELPEIIEVSEPQTSIQRELDYDQLFPDSIWTEYMTKRGDYPSLIAYKEYNNAIEWAYDSYNHVVENGETLWTIAQKEYGDELAWVVLFWDNEDLLNSQDGKLIPGMKLKIRSELWPEVE